MTGTQASPLNKGFAGRGAARLLAFASLSLFSIASCARRRASSSLCAWATCELYLRQGIALIELTVLPALNLTNQAQMCHWLARPTQPQTCMAGQEVNHCKSRVMFRNKGAGLVPRACLCVVGALRTLGLLGLQLLALLHALRRPLRLLPARRIRSLQRFHLCTPQRSVALYFLCLKN